MLSVRKQELFLFTSKNNPIISLTKNINGPRNSHRESDLEVIKKIMLNSAEHEISNTHRCKNIKKFSIFSCLYKPRMIFFPAH